MNLIVPDFSGHYYWPAHALHLSLMLASPLPSEIVFIILRMVPSLTYLSVYSIPDPPLFDCEQRFDNYSYADLHAPKPYGSY